MEKIPEFLANHLVLTTALVFILFMLVKSFLDNRGISLLKPQGAVELINRSNALVLDVRSDDEFKDGRILDSLHIPLGLLGDRLQELDKHRDRPILVSCRSGNRARAACSILKKGGFEQLYVLDGGVLAWQNANLPLQKV